MGNSARKFGSEVASREWVLIGEPSLVIKNVADNGISGRRMQPDQ